MELHRALEILSLGAFCFSIKTLAITCSFVLLYMICGLIHRLYLSPAATFPGPKLAALTFWYEFYYDVWLQGQYTWKIQELHREYGPFVRINPYELHCNDPEFFDILYVNGSRRRTDKWYWAMRQSWTRASVFKTIEHELHKQRRNQLSPFFSKSSIRTLEPLITAKIDRLCTRLQEARGTGKVVSLTHAFAALTVDIISHVCYGFSYDCLELDDFAREWYEGVVSSSRLVHLLKQFPWAFHLLNRFPSLASRATAAGMAAAKERKMALIQQVTAVVERHARGEKPSSGSDVFTIFDAMLDADVRAEEKSIARLSEEAMTLTAAGSLTTANTLDATFYYLLTSPDCLGLLCEELEAAIPDPVVLPSTAELEKLPYLTAVVCEGLRLGKGVPHRLARVSPDASYSYGDVAIPRGVPVGMSSIDILEHPDIFPEPHIFVPERWLPVDAPEVRQRRKSLVVFGGGSRMCLGLNLAWSELYLSVAAVVRRFGQALRLHDVDFERDVKITVDGFNPLPSRQSKGLRVTIVPER